MKRYSVDEWCPACGSRRHTVTSVQPGDATWPGSCKTEPAHLHRECTTCGGAHCRAAHTEEKPVYICLYSEKEILTSRAQRKSARPARAPKRTRRSPEQT